jgi:SAM-dependent methyltransferase
MLNHVFEHLHRPKEALREIWRILRSGGRLWMALPNRDALGLEIFGKYWRGLEAPRHLVLPTPATLRNLLASTSFSGIAFLEHPRCGGFISESSLAMKAGLDPTDCRSLQPQTAALARKLDRNSHANLNRAEIMIVIAEKNG